jgi:hypothetical protein
LDRQTEELRLARADRHITVAERHITEQRLRVDRLRADGHDTRTAEEMLREFEANLKTLREHRQIIVRTIEQIDNGLA